MKLPFLNRTTELAKIQKAIEAVDPCLIVLYGRRRCGKSRILAELTGQTFIYHLADTSDPALQRANLAHDIAGHLPGFDAAIYPTWQSLFSAFFSRIAPPADGCPATLIIDEFPYLVQLDPSLPSIIQRFYDTEQLGTHLILCGSSQRMMHGLVLDSTAPLYGRTAVILKIRPLEAGWIRPALEVDGIDALKAYAVWGGIPRYWEAARALSELRESVSELVFNRDGLFHQEPHRLLLDDMRSDVQPHSLLSVIAGGSNRLSEIAGRLNKRAINLSHPLNLLIDLGLVKREVPFGQSLRSTKRTLYRLDDPLLLFWYRYVYPAQSLLEQDVVAPVLQRWKEHFAQHAGEIWEILARRSVPRMLLGGIQWKEAHRWWGKLNDGTSAEIDVVAESMDGKAILLGEVKWGSATRPEQVHTRLHALSEKLLFCRGAHVIYAYWTAAGVNRSRKECEVIDAHQVLDALQ